MTLPKQQPGESDSDYQARLETARQRKKKNHRKYYEANKEAERERIRKWREANREALKERSRKYYEANKEAKQEYDRKRRETVTLAYSKGRPLQANYTRARRPKLLTKLLLETAESVVKDWGFGDKLDTSVLREAATRIRDSRYIDKRENPWYGTDYLADALIGERRWAHKIRATHRTR